MKRSLSVTIHSGAGDGKSWFGDTSPAPRLVLEAEGGSRFAPSTPKIKWDPLRQQMPVNDGTWQTCLVDVRDYKVLDHVVRLLEQGDHPFRSVIVDTLTEAQSRCLHSLIGTNQARTQDWGDLLRIVEDHVRRLRDLTIIDDNPVEVVVLILQATDKGTVTTKTMPDLRGRLGNTLPTFTDVVGYIRTKRDENLQLVREIQFQPADGIVAKDRTDRLGFSIPFTHPRKDPLSGIPTMLNLIFGPEVAEAPAANV